MTARKRPPVWALHEKRVVEMPEWEVAWMTEHADGGGRYERVEYIRAPHAWDAWKQVTGAPAFGSCRVRKIEQEKIDNESK